MKKLFKKELSVVIPAYNEAGTISELVKRIRAALSLVGVKNEIIVVDDNSTDRTAAIAKRLKTTLVKKKGKKGKAYSLLEGFAKAKYSNLAFIDADLQYAPEELGKMVLKLKNADIVVANRKRYKDTVARKMLSRTFRFAFGKALFGLNHDIQSGLKVFTKEAYTLTEFTPSSQWTFDLEFLYRASEAGFIITNHDISFQKRREGSSHIGLLKTSLEIGSGAAKLKTKRIAPVAVPSKMASSMRNAGMRYRKKSYITHSTLTHVDSSIITFTTLQKAVISLAIATVLVGLLLNTVGTLLVLTCTLSFIYFVDTLFNLFVVLKSLHTPQEITFKDSEIESLQDKNLPVYSILCPLYKEAHVIPQFVEAISKLSWPKKKLDVMLLLEEDDKESIAAAKKLNLPSYVRIVIVPDSQPKTKPKACNYGLSKAKGEYLVIFDAEDMPEPNQLKKAYLGFSKVGKEVVCLQAKLNYYNPYQNLLTRFFTAEYSLWFDITLTGLQSINTSIPLGGTSNHFRSKDIQKLQGWDPFNVTEDADLGMRLFKKGYKTAIIDSLTLEEANSKWGNWIRQRSRWIKGYMQTYLVHTRKSYEFAKTQGKHFPIFHLIIGGKIAFILINPFLWIATILYFSAYAYVGPTIERLYPSLVFYMAAFSLIAGNFLFMYYYMVGVMKRREYSLMKYTFLIPLYWLMISVAGFMALYQLIFKPFYWEKTVHGLHLLKKSEIRNPKFETNNKRTKVKNQKTETVSPKWAIPTFKMPRLSFAKPFAPIAVPLIVVGELEVKTVKKTVTALSLIGALEIAAFNKVAAASKKLFVKPFRFAMSLFI